MATSECGALLNGVLFPVTRAPIDESMNDIVSKAKTGIHGLDDVLAGGLATGCVFLLEGEPGAGKTTAGLQLLLAGAAAGRLSKPYQLHDSAC
jgi:predicted ATP-dependent serine protease